MPFLGTPTTVAARTIEVGAKTIVYYPGVINETTASPSSFSGSINPFGCNRIWTALHASADPVAPLINSRFRTPGRGVPGDFTSWLTQAFYADLNYVREGSLGPNCAAYKGTDVVGGPIIQEIGFQSPSAAWSSRGTLFIEEIQFQVSGHTGSPLLRLDVYVEFRDWS
jgi:hypothetical protein